MKKLLVVLFCIVAMQSCKKEIAGLTKNDHLAITAKKYLQTNLSQKDFALLDLKRTYLSHFADGKSILRIGYKSKKISEHFIALKFINDSVVSGTILEISGLDAAEKSKDKDNDGNISIYDIENKTKIISAIEDGYILAFHKTNNSSTPSSINPRPEVTTLPEVVVISHIHSSGSGISMSTWMNLMSIIDMGSSNGSTYAYFNNLDPYNIGGGGGSGNSGYPIAGNGNGGNYIFPWEQVPEVVIDESLLVDFENQHADPAIDLNKYLKCFTDIPDAGATGSIEIFADIPVNNDPNKFFDWDNGSPGHVFIRLTKTNGSQNVTQNIGFYPVSGWKTTITPAPIDGKFVDNAGHEFNASYKIDLTAAQIQTAVTRILYLNNFVRYDIDNYNCTDWALDVFNSAVPVLQRLEIPLYNIPGGEAPAGTSTPNGIFNKLTEMKATGSAGAANITIPYLGLVGASSGPCN